MTHPLLLSLGPEESKTEGAAHHTLVLSTGEGELHIRNDAAEPCRFVLIGGQPLKETIAQRGT